VPATAAVVNPSLAHTDADAVAAEVTPPPYIPVFPAARR
jgi:hypothetical protein